MCVHPLYISRSLGVPASYVRKSGKFKPDEESFLVVPCGKCEECRNAFLNKYLDACLFYSQDFYPFFLSCSIKPSMLSYRNGVSYFDSMFVNRFFRNLKNAGLISDKYHYIGIKERGGYSGRPHCHFILFIEKGFVKSFSTWHRLDDEFYKANFARYVKDFWKCWSVNIGTRKNPVYEQICDYVVKGRKSTFSLKPITGRLDKSLAYTLKYQFKQDNEFAFPLLDGSIQGKESFNLVRNKLLFSRGFHNWVFDYVDKPIFDIHPVFKVSYPFLRTTTCYKPLSLRNVKKLGYDDLYLYCLDIIKSQEYSLSDDLRKKRNDQYRSLKRLHQETNTLSFTDFSDVIERLNYDEMF